MAGPSVQNEWIVANHITGEDWRTHSERYWLRFAARYYRDRGRIEDWIGTLERLVALDDTFDTLVQADLRAAYVSNGMYLRGIGVLREVAERYPPSSSQRRWVDRELRVLLGEFRDQRVRRGTVEDRAESAELLLNYLEALEMEPGIPDVRAAIVALRRAGQLGTSRGAGRTGGLAGGHRAGTLVQHSAAADRGRAAGPRLVAARRPGAWRPSRGAGPPQDRRRSGAPHRSCAARLAARCVPRRPPAAGWRPSGRPNCLRRSTLSAQACARLRR